VRKGEAGRQRIPGTNSMDVTTKLINKLPKGPPAHRLEAFLAMQAVLAYVRRIGRPVVLDPTDAPRIQTAAMLHGIRLPLLAVQSAIERLMR
jgi:hypothetical protein